ncbi:hypothetical protein HN51_011852, partial [Arachis hypogaea]
LLSVRAPSLEKKLNLLEEIVVEHEIERYPAASETEFFKKHEDLLLNANANANVATAPVVPPLEVDLRSSSYSGDIPDDVLAASHAATKTAEGAIAAARSAASLAQVRISEQSPDSSSL